MEFFSTEKRRFDALRNMDKFLGMRSPRSQANFESVTFNAQAQPNPLTAQVENMSPEEFRTWARGLDNQGGFTKRRTT